MENQKPIVVTTHKLHDQVLDQLQRHCEVIANQTSDTLPREEILQRCCNADAMMAFMPDRVDDDFLARCPRLKIVSAALKGYDNFDVDACARRGVYLSFVPDLLTIPTAELAIGLTIGLTRHVRESDLFVRSGQFCGWSPRFYGLGMAGSTIGLMGFGAIGQAIAKRLSGWDCTLLYCDRDEKTDLTEVPHVRRVTAEHLLATSDIVMVGLPLTHETLHCIDQKALQTMKPGSCVVHPSRGSVVVVGAVASALQSGHLAGYAADVFEIEDWARADRPRHIHPALLNHPATLFTAHIGSAVANIRLAIEQRAATNILQVLAGEEPQDLAPPLR
ncbi:MAG: phosphonate dehydrogenase [Pseudomonadota bacterium]|nr:phosphonate dehydrogenase [Pseudomonadota bacterium]